MKFQPPSLNGFEHIEQTQYALNNTSREIFLEIYKQDLWFLCMTHGLVMLYKCMKFRHNISNGFQVIERT